MEQKLRFGLVFGSTEKNNFGQNKLFLTFLKFPLAIKDSNYLLFERELRLFQGLSSLFLPNVPGATFIKGGAFIPDSRVD